MKKIEFFSYVQGVADVCPIIPASSKMPRWVEACRQDFKENAVSDLKTVHPYRCPGIFEILGEGYYLTMPWDIIIETRGDPCEFKWTVPDATLAELMGDMPLVQSHREAARLLPTPPGSMATVIKLATPWHVKAPRNVKLLILPLSYPDTHEFEHVPGILDPGISSEINFLLRWNILNGGFKIKAGTPIAHAIPLSEEKFELVCRNATTWDNLWVQKRRYLNHFSFAVQRKKLKEAYNTHFNK